MKKEKQALSHYEACAELYPNHAPIWQNIGKICFDLKQYEKAGDCLLKAYEADNKKNSPALYHVAVSYIMAGKEKKALPHLVYLSSGQAGPPKIEWLEAMLKVYMDLQLNEKTFELINRLLDKNGNHPRWWKILAQFYLQQNDYKNALAALTIHSYLTPVNREDMVLLGDLASTVGVPLKAGAYYKKALSLSNRPADYEKLASAYLAAYKPAKAKQVLTMALEKKPESGLWFMMGQVLYQEENFDKAYHAFDQSARLDPGNGEAYLMMGYCALRIDRKDSARSAFQKACRFSKQRKMAEELLRQAASWKER
jgi:tetratricopeptide (TPR) repeat protein